MFNIYLFLFLVLLFCTKIGIVRVFGYISPSPHNIESQTLDKDDYLIEYKDIKGKTIQDLLNLLNRIHGKSLKELRVQDLSYYNGIGIWPGSGVYLFRHRKEVVYVGKVSSMSFTERIPKHFDLRHDAYMNRLLELVSEKVLQHKKDDHYNYKHASEHAFKNFNVVLINFENPDNINRIERLLRSCTQPLNRFKNLIENDLDKTISEY